MNIQIIIENYFESHIGHTITIKEPLETMKFDGKKYAKHDVTGILKSVEREYDMESALVRYYANVNDNYYDLVGTEFEFVD